MLRFLLALSLTFGAIGVEDAWAGKKDATEDPYAYPEFGPTSVPDFDTFFSNAKSPVVSVIDSRKKIDQARKDLNVALEVTEGAPLSDALASLSKKADGKIKRVMKTGKLPRLEAKDVLPENVKASMEGVNNALEQLDASFHDLEQLKPQLAELATKSAEMIANAPDTIKNSGVPVTKVPGALSATKKNGKVVGDSSDHVTKLIDSLTAIKGDFEGAFTE